MSDLSKFTVESRKNDLSIYMFELNEKMEENFLDNTLSYFNKDKLAEGIEGIVYKSQFKNKKFFLKNIAIKVVNIEQVINVKGVSLQFLNISPTDAYKKFFDIDDDFMVDEPLFTEVYCFTLINQIIYQNICPHFIQNYTWEFSKEKTFNIYNEYVNGGDLYSFMEQSHSAELWYNVLFQIMIAIISYRKYFGMIHGDLHTGNVLIHKIPKGGFWKYTLNGKNYYLPNLGYIFIINDFGFASIPEQLQIEWYYNDKLQYLTKKVII